MKLSIFTSLVLVASVTAAPTKRANGSDSQPEGIDDITVLNFALTLEHLENAFYKGALERFDEKAFTDAGFSPDARGWFAQIAAHEQAHVGFLTAALGSNATQPCNYSFPYTDPISFAALSQALEGTGVSAYIGAAQLLSNKTFLTAAASVLSTEARHASWVASAVNKINPWSGPYDVPLGLNETFTIAATFITSCPSSNPALPVKAFPPLTFPNNTAPTSTVTVNFTRSDAVNASTPLFAAFFTGLSQVFAPVAENGSVVIPKDLFGTVYAVVTTNETQASDDNIVAGPATLDFPFNANGSLIVQ